MIISVVLWCLTNYTMEMGCLRPARRSMFFQLIQLVGFVGKEFLRGLVHLAYSNKQIFDY